MPINLTRNLSKIFNLPESLLAKIYDLSSYQMGGPSKKFQKRADADVTPIEVEVIRLSILYYSMEVLATIAQEQWYQLLNSHKKPEDIIIAAILLASKTIVERYGISNRLFAQSTGLDLIELNRAESNLLNALQFNIPLYPSDQLVVILGQEDSELNVEKIRNLRHAFNAKMLEVQVNLLSGISASLMALCHEYQQHLTNSQPKQDSSASKKLKIYNEIITIMKNDVIPVNEKIKQTKAVIEKVDFKNIICSNRDYHVFHCIFIALTFPLSLPALAVKSKFYSDKNTFSFWKSHGQILHEKLTKKLQEFETLVSVPNSMEQTIPQSTKEVSEVKDFNDIKQVNSADSPKRGM